MYKIYLTAKRDSQIESSFYYDEKLQPGLDVLHNNTMYETIHSREVSEIYSSEEIKEECIRVLNKTYHTCSENEIEYIIYSLDKKTVDNLNDMSNE